MGKQAQPTWRRVTTSVLSPVCEHLRLYKFQTETKRGEAERAEHEQKQVEKSGKKADKVNVSLKARSTEIKSISHRLKTT